MPLLFVIVDPALHPCHESMSSICPESLLLSCESISSACGLGWYEGQLLTILCGMSFHVAQPLFTGLNPWVETPVFDFGSGGEERAVY